MSTTDDEVLPSSQFDEIDDRLSVVEALLEQKKKGIAERVGVIGGLFALLISLITGGYTIYDRTVLRPEQIIAEQKRELNQIAEALSKLQDTAAINLPKIQDPLLKEQVFRSINTRISLKLQRSRELIQALGNKTGIGELLVFGYYEANTGNLSGARDIFELALTVEAPSKFTQEEVFAQLGQFYMFPGADQ